MFPESGPEAETVRMSPIRPEDDDENDDEDDGRA